MSQHNSPIQRAYKSYPKGLFSSSSQEGPTSSSKKRIFIATAISHQNRAPKQNKLVTAAATATFFIM